MATYDQNNAQCFVFTFKEGLLSPVAHDLRIRVERFAIEVSESSVTATFDTASLRVDSAMKDGRNTPSALSDADKTKIERQIRDDVLHSKRHSTATFESRSIEKRADGGYDLSGELTLHGTTRPLEAKTVPVRDGQRLEVTLHQPDFGIVPYKAMMGALKVQPDVKVRIDVGVRKSSEASITSKGA